MEASLLQKNQPYLDAVFGPLSAEDDSKIRGILSQVDIVLVAIARHFGREGAGWTTTGLELAWMQSGQVSVRSYVEAGAQSGGGCIDFGLELRPSWYFGERSSVLTWDVELAVYADCMHAVDHGYMHTVHEVTVRVGGSAINAATALSIAVQDLKRLAVEVPAERWLEMSSDSDSSTAMTSPKS